MKTGQRKTGNASTKQLPPNSPAQARRGLRRNQAGDLAAMRRGAVRPAGFGAAARVPDAFGPARRAAAINAAERALRRRIADQRAGMAGVLPAPRSRRGGRR